MENNVFKEKLEGIQWRARFQHLNDKLRFHFFIASDKSCENSDTYIYY